MIGYHLRLNDEWVFEIDASRPSEWPDINKFNLDHPLFVDCLPRSSNLEGGNESLYSFGIFDAINDLMRSNLERSLGNATPISSIDHPYIEKAERTVLPPNVDKLEVEGDNLWIGGERDFYGLGYEKYVLVEKRGDGSLSPIAEFFHESKQLDFEFDGDKLTPSERIQRQEWPWDFDLIYSDNVRCMPEIVNFKSALPCDDPIEFNVENIQDVAIEDWSSEDHVQYRLLADILNQIIRVPFKFLKKYLGDIRHVGPIREFPGRNHVPPLTPNPSRYSSGMWIWDEFSNGNIELAERVNDKLQSPEFLDIGYGLNCCEFVSFDRRGFLYQRIAFNPPLDDIEEISEEIRNLPTSFWRTIFLDENETEIDVNDIAIGITQLVPVVGAVVEKRSGLTLIEQPEIHNHPRIEVRLGDLFIDAIRNKEESKRFILETHGEHLFLRLLRRIRETTKGTVKKGFELSAGEIGVYFVEKVEGKTVVRKIDIDIEGDFIQPWPDDFFEIDFKERNDLVDRRNPKERFD